MCGQNNTRYEANIWLDGQALSPKTCSNHRQKDKHINRLKRALTCKETTKKRFHRLSLSVIMEKDKQDSLFISEMIELTGRDKT